jgi:predicted lipoprotein with Yx(FWY)xxD motif
MKAKNELGFGLAWLIVAVAIIVSAGVGYIVYRSNTNSDTNSTIPKQESITESTDVNTQPKTEDTAPGQVIKSGDSEFGTILFDGDGRAIYIWEVETTPTAECYGDCAEAWPPVLTDGTPTAIGAVDGKLLGTTQRTDGKMQVTYNGHPLYYYAHEEAGEVKCHNIRTHGGLWWVIQPSGVRAD